MRGNLKHGCHRHRSNKHYKKQIVWVLLDSGSDGDLVFVNTDKPMLLPYPKRLVPQSWNTSNGIFQIKRNARVELNFLDDVGPLINLGTQHNGRSARTWMKRV